jgi:hypothetical protein
MPRHPPIALKTLDRSHCQCPPAQFQRNCRFSRTLTRSASAQSEGLPLKPNPVQDRDLMSLAQKDQLLEIGSRVRLGKPIICGRLSVSRDKSQTFRLMKFEQIFSLQCQTEQAESMTLAANLFTNDFFHLYSTPSKRQSCGLRSRQTATSRMEATILRIAQVVEPDGIEPTTSCLQSRRSPS